MELVMLENVDKKTLLANANEKNDRSTKKKEISCKIEIYDPKPQGIVDSIVSKKIAELREKERKKIKTENTEREKLMNALVLTDIAETIKNAGLHPDGSPKVAIAGLFDKETRLDIVDDGIGYFSKTFSFILKREDFPKYTNKKKMEKMEIRKSFYSDYCTGIFLLTLFVIFGMGIFLGLTKQISDNHSLVLCVGGSIFLFIVHSAIQQYCFLKKTSLYMNIVSTDKRRKIICGISTKVPQIHGKVLKEITGYGPFSILFEVNEGWRKIAPDPVIFRIINIDGQQFFEPVVGYDMTPLEKASLVEA